MTMPPSPIHDPRIGALQAMLEQLITGEPPPHVIPSEQNDAIDHLIHSANQLADRFIHIHNQNQTAEQRTDELLEIITSLATRDYSRRAHVQDHDSIFDALATGLNMLADELVAGQETQIRLQEEIIQNQAVAIQELSTPLIPISEGVLVMPLIGTIDSTRAQQVMERLLTGIAETQSHTVILDITGVAVVDTQVANALTRAAHAARLLGACVVLTGIRPEVAQTLVGLGTNLQQIITQSTLQAGITFAAKRNTTLQHSFNETTH